MRGILSADTDCPESSPPARVLFMKMHKPAGREEGRASCAELCPPSSGGRAPWLQRGIQDQGATLLSTGSLWAFSSGLACCMPLPQHPRFRTDTLFLGLCFNSFTLKVGKS